MSASKSLGKEITQSLPHLNVKQKKTVLTVAKAFIEKKQDWWDQISEDQQLAIDKSLREMKSGKLTTHEEVMKSYKKWVKK